MARIVRYIKSCVRPDRGAASRQSGATMMEYALIVAVISIAIIAVASTVFEDGIDSVGTKISNAIEQGGDQ
jgi:Flp pilus assembly pilin Flp